MKIWSEQEIEFLKLNYPDNGLLYCVENLNKHNWYSYFNI